MTHSPIDVHAAGANSDPRYWLQLDTQTQWGASRYTTFQRCPRAHALRYADGIETVDRPEHFGVGSLVHAALAFVRDGVMRGELERDWHALIDIAGDLDLDMPPEVQAEAYRLVRAYEAHYGHACGWDPKDDRIRVLGIETPLGPMQIGELPFTARADAIVEMAGSVTVWDTKTRGRKLPNAREEYARGLRTRVQYGGLACLTLYVLGLEQPPAIIQDTIIKTKLAGFDRLTVQLNEGHLAAWIKQQVCVSYELYSTPPSLATPRWINCAPEIGNPCEFFYWCHGSDEERERHYRIRKESNSQ